MYSFSLIGKQYESKRDAEKGIKIEISNVEYTLVKNRFVSIGILIDAEIRRIKMPFLSKKERKLSHIFEKERKTQQFAVFSLT